MESFWQKKNNSKAYPRINQDLKCDILIIGGGLTGISLAYRLQESNQHIVVLEKNKIGSGMSAMNHGKISIQHGLVYQKLKEADRYEYIDASTNARQWIESIATKHSIECDLKKIQTALFATSDKNVEALKQEATIYDQLSIPYKFSLDVTEPLAMKCCLTLEDQAQYDPLAFLFGLTHQLKENVSIYEDSSADTIHYEDGICTTVSGFEIQAQKIIVASQFPVFEGWRFYLSRFEYKRGYCIAFKTVKALQDHAYLSLDDPYLSFREITWNQQSYTILSGFHYPIHQKTTDPYQHLIQYAYHYFSAKDIVAQWSAQDLFTSDAMPFIGKLRGEVYVATGFNGWGNTMSIAASEIIANLLLDSNYIPPYFANPKRFSDIFSTAFLSNNAHVAGSFVSGFTNKSESLENIKNGCSTKMQNRHYGYYKDKKGQEYLVDLRCPHLGCPLQWNPHDFTWDCPCHGSRFHYDGTSLTAPGSVRLQQYPAVNELHPNLK